MARDEAAARDQTRFHALHVPGRRRAGPAAGRLQPEPALVIHALSLVRLTEDCEELARMRKHNEAAIEGMEE